MFPDIIYNKNMIEPKLIRTHNKYCEIVGNKNKPKIKECYF